MLSIVELVHAQLGQHRRGGGADQGQRSQRLSDCAHLQDLQGTQGAQSHAIAARTGLHASHHLSYRKDHFLLHLHRLSALLVHLYLLAPGNADVRRQLRFRGKPQPLQLRFLLQFLPLRLLAPHARKLAGFAL